ncbi:MAG: tubulin/FtsZ family protein [Methanofollis sp.]|uniref:tubulin/FtsZ family protein n=1 Tax=Methanofollis sp. TaxID=2052835 RepID=UPI00261DC088|nr:tubulin/FtsZ family protein [Methanofollis sp.]MDD4254783.1 tubulin/FtsZ family protein [Methanofollis sp.]
MRVLAIGLGGAGSRIVDRLYDHDRRSKVLCMNALVIDYDSNTLIQLEHLPEESKLFFPPIDPSFTFDVETVVDIEEVMTCIQKVDTVEIDAIMVITGLGGTMIDTLPQIIPQLRQSFVEPIFAVVTLPCRDEGIKRAAKAADDLEMISGLVDGTIVFDNETWAGRVRSGDEPGRTGLSSKIAGRRGSFMNPRRMYSLLNDEVARRIGLLLRAGEFNETGLDVGELVLDAGEVLNTLSGMGIVAVGYAAERLPPGPLEFLTRWSSARNYMEGSKKRAARIVSLAKKAVYEEISVPCDLTSAEKALVLIAGPDRELSIRGFVTVRKWIDRSIAGLEMRSGDYPIKNTRFVGIIIVLSGVQNVPRIDELKVHREEYRQELEEEAAREAAVEARGQRPADFDEDAEAEAAFFTGYSGRDPLAPGGGGMEMTEEKDDMIAIAGQKRKKEREDGKLRIHLSSDHLKKTGDDEGAVVVPGAKKQTPGDMTRMTSVGLPQAPKDSALGIGGQFSAVKKPKEIEETGFRVEAIPAAKDDVLSGEKVSLKWVVKKAKDDLLGNDAVLLNDPGTRPIDDVLRGGMHLAPKQKPKEIEPGRGKITGLETKKQEEEEEEESQDSIEWIR